METDYSKIGLKVGLEIHQQLNTKTKLFCSCPPKLFTEEPEIKFLRRLRPTQSELGQVDPAAFFEFQKGTKIRYQANRATSCLVEMDEEPPHPLNKEAIEILLTTALMMNAEPVDEVHVMRKTVIDGSNTTGFQRTCVIAVDGWIKVGEKVVPIQHASLEEDAARKIGKEEKTNIICYRIDRLGIPLIEVATAPVIYSPAEAQEVAFAIGQILRDTGKVRRGLGTIRQDLNVSIPNGALVEIKGVQELELISRVVEYEVQRQLNLLKISKKLQKKGVKGESLKENFFDVTDIFKNTKCKIILKAIKKGQRVKAVKLRGFGGLLKQELMPNFRLGTEMADHARFWGRIGGIFHTDEMPAYGVTPNEIRALKNATGATEEDAVVFVADVTENMEDGLKAVVERAQEATEGVPSETRAANPDATTRYMRPRPGAARMYPETDIPPSLITKTLIENIRSNLPERAEKKFKRLKNEYSLNDKLAKQIINSESGELFEAIAKESNVSATTVAVFLTETLTSMRRDGVSLEKVTNDQIMEVFKGIGSGEIAKEALSDVFIWLSKNEGKNLQNAIIALKLKMLSRRELITLIDGVISENRKLVDDDRKRALRILMGLVMKEVRGKANPSVVKELLRGRLK